MMYKTSKALNKEQAPRASEAELSEGKTAKI